MSDLSRAVAERTADFRPDLVPPFALVRARKRRRDRLRAGGAVVLSALAVGGVVLLPSWLELGAGEYAGGRGTISFDAERPGYAPPSPVPHAAGYSLSYALEHPYDPARDGAALERCATLPGVRDRYAPLEGEPPVTNLDVHGQQEVLAVDACVHALPGVEVGGYEVVCDDEALCPEAYQALEDQALQDQAGTPVEPDPPYEVEVVDLAGLAAMEQPYGAVLRTTYSDDAAFQRLLDRLTVPDAEYGARASIFVVEDPELDGLSVDEALRRWPEGTSAVVALVADEASLTHPDAAVWAADVSTEPEAPPFRIAATQLWSFQANVPGNMFFYEWADAVGPDGVFREFPS